MNQNELKNWIDALNKLWNYSKNPQKLWVKIRKIKGNKTTRNGQLIINNSKFIQEADIEKKHREIWQNIFKISDEENKQYDPETGRRVRDYLNNNTDPITPHQTSVSADYRTT